MKTSYRYFILVLIALISLAMHLPHFSKELVSIHVWRQTQTQSTINSFYEEDFNILNPKKNDRGNSDGIFRMEFPLMQWIVAGFYKLFGKSLVFTRVFMFVVGLCSVIAMYKFLFQVFGNHLPALIGAWAFNFSPSFYYHSINPMPDNFALCLSMWGLYFFFSWITDRRNSSLMFAGFFLALGALCKLPFILYFTLPAAYFFFFRSKANLSFSNFILLFCFMTLPLAWYLRVTSGWDENGIVKGMLANDLPIKVIIGYFSFNFISTLPELMLNYGSVLFFVSSFYFMFRKGSYSNTYFLMFALWSFSILAYFIFEINQIAKIHDYYLFPFYPIIFLLVAYGAWNLFQSGKTWKVVSMICLMVLPVTAYLRNSVRWSEESPGFNKDLLTYKNELRSAVPKNDLCVVGNDDSHFIFFYYIDKKGWGFDHDYLSGAKLHEMIDNDAKYLFSDSRAIDSNPEILSQTDSLVLSRGSINVYRLKKN